METKPRFSLEDAVRCWRENLASTPAPRPEDLAELECHLRDSIAGLNAKGLSNPEAFWVATKRMGTAEQLDSEFGKVNGGQVWLRRALWMVAGFVVISGMLMAASIPANLAVVAAHAVTGQERVIAASHVLAYAATVAALILVCWRSGMRPGGLARRLDKWGKERPATVALAALVCTAIVGLGSVGANSITARSLPIETVGTVMLWQQLAKLAGIVLWPLMLAFLLIKAYRRETREGPRL